MIAVEPTDVAKGVRAIALRTPTLPPATHTNVFLLGTREVVLVEPASPYRDELDRITEWLTATMRAENLTLRAILLTHHHPDHVGGANELRSRLGVPLWAHALTAERLANEIPIDRHIEGGEAIELDGPHAMVIDAVHTPGHAPGHLCFMDRASKVLIAGDMVAGIGTILVERIDGDMQLYLRSLEEMDALRSSALLPAHGGPIANAHEKLRFYIAHRLERERKVLDALRQRAGSGPVTVRELVPLAYADTPKMAWPFAERAADAHLIKLEREGLAVARGDRWLAI